MSKAEYPPLPEAALEERFLAATGPGGQNVNKVETAAQLRLDVFALGLDPESYKRLKVLAGSRWTSEGEIVVTARTHRTREANRAAARERLAELVWRARQAQPKRRATRPSKAAKAKRLEAKAARSNVKQGRGRVDVE